MGPDSRTYGHIPGVSVGATFRNREELIKAGVHAQSQAGIHGDPKQGGGAFSICISEGYEDNEDMGERIIYVGAGGQDTNGQQIEAQSINDPRNGNLALSISCETKRPVRVVRGKNKSSHYAPASGYRYDGLYVVDSAIEKAGKKGYKMCFFELRRIREDGDRPLPTRRLLTFKKMAGMRRKAGNK